MKEYWVFYVVDGNQPVDLDNCEIVVLRSFWKVVLFLIWHRRELTHMTIIYR